LITNERDRTFDKHSLPCYTQLTERRIDAMRPKHPTKTQLLKLTFHHTIPQWIFSHQAKGKMDGETRHKEHILHHMTNC